MRCNEEQLKIDNSQQITACQQKGKKVFTVIKNDYHYNILKQLDDIPVNEDNNESEIVEEKSSSNRLSAISKVNFTKLTNEEKDERLKNLARLVKQLRKKLRKFESKPQGKDEEPHTKLIAGFLKANKYLHSDKDFKSEENQKMLENLINLILEKKLELNSIYFRKIIKQIRRCMTKSSSSISQPRSVDSFLEGNTLSSSSSASVFGTQHLDYNLLSSLSCFGMLPDYHQNQNQIGLNSIQTNVPTSTVTDLNKNYSQYSNYFINNLQAIQSLPAFNLNQYLISTILPYQFFKLPF